MEENELPQQIRFSYGINIIRAITISLGVILVLLLFVLPGEILQASGAFSPLIILITSLFILGNMLGYIELSMSVSRPGSAYQLVDYCEEGNWISFITGWLMLFAGTAAAGLLARGFGTLLSSFLQGAFQIVIPALPLSAGIIVLIYLYKITVSQQNRFQNLLLVTLTLGLILILFAVPGMDRSALEITQTRWQTGFQIALLAFIALEITAAVQGEMTRRTTNAPRALLLIPILAGLISAGGLMIMRAVERSSSANPSLVLEAVGSAAFGKTGILVLLGIGILSVPIALKRIMLLLTQLGYAMTVDGFWPDFLLKTRLKSRTPIYLISFLTLMVAITLFIPASVLIETGSLLYLLVLLSVNLALARREQLTSASFNLPIHPWLPALAVVLDTLLLLTWGEYLVQGAVIVLAGSLFYILYGRLHSIEAKEGITVFKAPSLEQTPKKSLRVLVPISNPETAETLLHMAGTLVKRVEGKVIALRVITVPNQVSLSEGSRQAESDRVLLDRAIAQATKEEFRVQAMTRVSRSVSEGVLDTAREERVDQIILGWTGDIRSFSTSLGPVIDPIFRNAPCDVMVIKGDSWRDINSILVPTSGGPNAPVGARVAAKLSQIYEADVTGLFVQVGRATPRKMDENRAIIEATLEDLDFHHPPEAKVIMADNALDGIIKEAQDYDLVIVGASEQGVFDQFTFGSIPQKIAAQAPNLAALVKGYKGTPEFWFRKFITSLFNLFPTLTIEEQLEVREELIEDAQPGTNYFVMITLSSIIATLGLLLNSPAVVIGAMLVAPLMSPILGFSMGIVLGEIRLIRMSLESVLKGVIATIVVALLVGLISPFKEMTVEILSRTQPTLLDLFIALASGMAGAYAVSRKDVSAALPGVAIAAALAPPLSAVGIGFATANAQVAGGALLLFVTNIITISLAGVITFTLLGIHPLNLEPETKRRVRRGVIGMSFLVFIITIPLAIIMNGIIRQTQDQKTIEDVLLASEVSAEFSVMDVEWSQSRDQLTITAVVRSTDPFDQLMVDEMAEELEEALQRPLTLEVITLPITISR